jgi:hypothetical protein
VPGNRTRDLCTSKLVFLNLGGREADLRRDILILENINLKVEKTEFTHRPELSTYPPSLTSGKDKF